MHKRYDLREPGLDAGVEALVEEAQERWGRHPGGDYVRQMMVAALGLLRDGATVADLKLSSGSLKELRHTFRVFAPFARRRKVAVFGSARTPPDSPDWVQARAFAERIVRAGWMVITGAGPGIMAAAQGGAGRDDSFGVNIRLPFEQVANDVIRGDPKLVNYRYFFTRKITFVKEAHAIALFPGGYGTHDEAMEALTLIQTGKSELLPVVFVDAPGDSYWRDWLEWVRTHPLKRGYLSAEDLDLLRVCDDADAAVSEILRFYANYHSSRYVRDRLVIRVQRAPDGDELAALNRDFEDVVTDGSIETSAALPEENGELPELARVVLRFDRRRPGRLRLLVDRLNELLGDLSSPADEALPHEIERAGAIPRLA